MGHRLSCSAACRIFPDQGSNPCLLHWQTNSLPWATREALDHFLLKCCACVLDIIGICKNYEDVTKIIVKSNNREVSKRNIYLMDMSGKVVNATLWGDDVSARVEWRECVQKGGDTKSFLGGGLASGAVGCWPCWPGRPFLVNVWALWGIFESLYDLLLWDLLWFRFYIVKFALSSNSVSFAASLSRFLCERLPCIESM